LDFGKALSDYAQKNNGNSTTIYQGGDILLFAAIEFKTDCYVFYIHIEAIEKELYVSHVIKGQITADDKNYVTHSLAVYKMLETHFSPTAQSSCTLH
jgi:hypothetical protein